MENLFIDNHPEYVYFPIVDFNQQTGICEISGESYMEETYQFYEPVIAWLQEYISVKNALVFKFKLTYFNTSSSRFILEILSMIKKFGEMGGKVDIQWFYKRDDPDILTEIQDFMDETGVKIMTVPF